MDAKESAEALAHLREIVECESYPACCSKPLRLAIAALELQHEMRWRSVEIVEELPPFEEPRLVTVVREGEEPIVLRAVRLPVNEWDADREDTVEVPAWCHDFEAEPIYGTVTHWRPMPARAQSAP